MLEITQPNLSVEDKGLIHFLTMLGLLAGIWLLISPFSFGYLTAAARWNQIMLGILIFSLSLIRYLSTKWSWASWVNVALGLWLVIAPFVLSYALMAAYWNEILTGLVVLAVNLGAAMVSHDTIEYSLKR